MGGTGIGAKYLYEEVPAGVAPIIVIDVLKQHLDKALELGAHAVLNAEEVDVVSEVVKSTDAGPDAILICVRRGKVLNQAADMVRHDGTIVVAGYMAPIEVYSPQSGWEKT